MKLIERFTWVRPERTCWNKATRIKPNSELLNPDGKKSLSTPSQPNLSFSNACLETFLG